MSDRGLTPAVMAIAMVCVVPLPAVGQATQDSWTYRELVGSA